MTVDIFDNQKTPENSYLGNPSVKRDGIVADFTQEQIVEYAKCMGDPAYFARNYLKVIHLDHGLVPFDLYPYQEEMFKTFDENRFSIVLACRQSGKSISSCAYLLHYAIFNPEKTVAILANKGATAREMVGRITLMLENLPFWLQPGCKALNKGTIEFSNNSRIISAGTSSSAIRGLSCSVLYADEFAFIQNDAQFYTSVFPVISSGKTSKIIVTSTANGLGNTFHKLWQGASQKTNDFVPFQVDWWDVPGRDEEWKKQTIANTSEMQFRQEFGNSFLGQGNTLIDPNKLLSMSAREPEYHQRGVSVYEGPKENHQYVMTVDVAQGRGQDYSTFSVFDVTSPPFKQVATYRDNNISPLLFPEIIYKYGRTYNDAFILVESNDQGIVVCNSLYYELEYENLFVESAIKAGALGVRMTSKVKRIGCSVAKDLIEEDKLLILDANTILELSSFESSGSSYEASRGNHDDLVMNVVMFGWFTSIPFFSDISDINLRHMIHAENIKTIEDDVLPFGFINNHIEHDYAKAKEILVDDGSGSWLS